MNRLSGVHVPHHKNTTQSVPVRIPTPEKVVILMSQHIGAPCSPCVKIGDIVDVGQVIGEPSGFVSAPIHASVSGKVTALEEVMTASGAYAKAVVITSDGEQRLSPSIKPPELTDLASFTAAVRTSGLVGLGGAGFPAAVKLSPKDPSAIDTIVINAAECEPYITSDLRTMMDKGDKVIAGINLVRKYLGTPKAIIGIEDNKPEAIQYMQELAAKHTGIEVLSLPAMYPQGGEKVLIYHALGRIVGEGKLPSDVGVIVMNVTSIAFLAEYMETGIPLIEKCMTVDGTAVNTPKNVIAPVGTPLKDVYAFCGGFKGDPKKVLLGGPMMGVAVPTLEQPVMKNTNASLAFLKDEALLPPTTACIRCGRCVMACPFHLKPAALEHAFLAKNADMLEKLKVNLCMECGCCSFSCPAKRDLVLANKLGKAFLREKKVK